MPLRLVRADPRDRDARVAELLELVGLAARAGTARTSSPAASSSGWRSRAPWPTGRKLLLADEPTGQLDSETGHADHAACSARVVRAEGVTAVVATHDPVMLDVADRVLELRDGMMAEASTPIPA